MELMTVRNKTLLSAIDEVVHTLAEVIAWPDSKINQELADNAIKKLRKSWKEEGYPRMFLYFSVVYIAHNMVCDAFNRKHMGLKLAWNMLGELLD
jgi:hypothetical protein